jgi:two-component system response regulator
VPSNTGCILLVEDNPDDEELTVMALKESGVRNEIEIARDGVEALARLLGNGVDPPPKHPALVLLDLKLPKIDGFGVLSRIRENESMRHLPVVILTSSDAEEDFVRGYNLGANSYVRKPVSFPEFAGAVKQLGLYWLLLNEVPRR